MISLPALAVLLPLVSASPLLDERQACGQYDTVTSGPYSLLTNLWGEFDASYGQQCSTLDSVNNNVVAWSTNWGWSGGATVKSFSNIQLNEGVNQQLGAISSMPSHWSWSQSDDGYVVADVAYDFFTSYSAGGSNAFEVMIWLASFNAGPICAYDSDGQPVPIASDVGIGVYTWNVYLGSNGYNPVYSFLPASGNINDFSGDMYAFFSYLIDNGYLDASQYLKTAQAGTEATSGSATLDTSSYSLSIN